MPESPSVTATKLLLEALERDQLPFLMITSDSMAPLLRQGDQIQLAQTSPEAVKVGDIVVTGSQANLVAHRYWGTLESNKHSYLITRGDRLAYYDPPLPASQLTAVVVGRQRNNRLLDLRQRSGSWLNHRLTQLAKQEARAIGLAWPTLEPQMKVQIRPGLTGRIQRRLLLSISTLLVSLVELIA